MCGCGEDLALGGVQPKNSLLLLITSNKKCKGGSKFLATVG